MKLRCPYCKTVFEKLDKAQCPTCGRTLLMPRKEEAITAEAKAEAKARRAIRAKRAAAAAAGMASARPSPLMLPVFLLTYRSRFFLWGLVLAAIIAGQLLLKKVDPGQVRAPSKLLATQGDLGALHTALEWFRANCKRYPTTEEGLKALVRNPGVPGWQSYYIEALYPDRWGHPFQYACSNGQIRLFSLGPDGVADTADDIPAPAPDYKALLERVKITDLPRWATNAPAPGTNTP
jgi:general secretion pathway protein G